MTQLKNGILYVQPEPDGKCEYCGNKKELRPYGKNGERICFECGMKPENKATTKAMFNELLDQTTAINPNSN